jgi:hypothetical protein
LLAIYSFLSPLPLFWWLQKKFQHSNYSPADISTSTEWNTRPRDLHRKNTALGNSETS